MYGKGHGLDTVPPLPLGSCCLAAGVGLQPLDDFAQPPHGVRIPMLPEFKSSGKITGIHHPPNVCTAVRNADSFQSLPINPRVLVHCISSCKGAVATAGLAADRGRVAHWE